MHSGLETAQVAALVGEPARANMLMALSDGRALTATELAFLARITPQTASGHLAKLVDGRLLIVAQQGRHRYFRLASPLVSRMLESINAMAAIEGPPRHRRAGPADLALRRARYCYDHLAGWLGVTLADALIARGDIEFGEDGGVVTAAGERRMAGFGLDLAALGKTRRAFCRPCIDWSERRPHIAGAVGAALAARCFDLGWLARIRDTRALAITAEGRAGLGEAFGIAVPDGSAADAKGPPPQRAGR
ncbi:MAG: helix-turn-helix transcriptional regulator [Rhodospirillaceae bacterium]|nr:helix-turn-helix transcriptional regulator [Rhodospirillaceae bacterium]